MIEIDGQKYVCRIITYHFADKSFLFRYNKKQGVGILFVQNKKTATVQGFRITHTKRSACDVEFHEGRTGKSIKKRSADVAPLFFVIPS